MMNCQLNEKYKAFYVTGFNRNGDVIQIGKIKRTIEEALRAAKNADQSKPNSFHFIDIVQPKKMAQP
jgi:hypothetical protein